MKEKLIDLYHDIRIFFVARYEMLNRMLFWCWNLRWNWDFDSYTIYVILHLKLTRLYECFKNNGHCVWNAHPNTKLMRRLREAIVLAKMLYDDRFNKRQLKIFKTYKIIGEKQSRWYRISYKNQKPIPEKLYRVLYRKAMEKDGQEYLDVKNRLFKLLNENIEKWWD